ncbi:MAG: helix-turn-helix transcriptional regulator [Phaeodactylibacter sp.]|nr:helix-turn-helix transcriptional regulator [Phaeodactylibacter sp.]MCB9300447.1 helix-turn-helix transcriptional regulator [Lewinellaceae bacterium]HQU57611.1 helix-turn-helix transcriptional regulator [Saprospiraceae bacterium]
MVESTSSPNPTLLNFLKAQVRAQRHKEWLDAVHAAVLAGLGEPSMVINDIASAVFISERQFYRKLKKLTGLTPNQFIQQIRMEQAQKLLQGQEYDSVSRVAKAVGFLSSDYFSLLYERYYGVKPAVLLERA